MSGRVKAVVRVRPPFKTEVVVPGYSNVVRTVTSDEHQKVIVAFPDHFREFDFDVVLGPEYKQDQVYQNVGAPLVDEVLKGYSSTLLAYGQTGTGKTHTLGILTAPRPEDHGIVTRALVHTFDYIENHPENEWAVSLSCIQIYKEMIIDMLNPQHTNMSLREDPVQGVFVEGLEERPVFSLPVSLSVINSALENRVMASTLMNATSSRSHTIIKMKLQQRVTQNFEGTTHQLKGFQFTKTVTGTLTLVDLAGSERIKKTNSHGERLEEAKSINVSLSTLGKVISALTTTGPKQAHIPFRDSKLTRLLQDSLGGNVNTTLIAAIGPSISHRDETLSTLSFAMRCMKIKVNPVSDRVSVGESDYADWCLNLQQQIANLQQEFKDKEAMYLQKIKTLTDQNYGVETSRDSSETPTPRVKRSNSASSVQTNRSSTPVSRPGVPDTWQPSHDFLFFHYQLLQEIAQATVHLAQHTHATNPSSLDFVAENDADDADELWAIARERIDEKIASLHTGTTQHEQTSTPFTNDLEHPVLSEFSEERELIIYLIQLRSLMNSNLDFALHWMDTRQNVVSGLHRQLILQEVEAIRKQREMDIWAEAMNKLIEENKQLRHALRSKKRDFRIAQDNNKLLKLRIKEMTSTSQSKTMANMVKVPYITAHDLTRLDKAIRTLQLRFLIKRRQRLVKNVNNAQRRLSNSNNNNNNNQQSKFPRQASTENGIAGAYPRNTNGHDASVNDTTFDEVSFNESSVASNDLSMEHNNEKIKKPKRSFMRKIGGLFASSDKQPTKEMERSPQTSPDLENGRTSRSSSVSDTSMASTGSALLESSINTQLLQHRLKLHAKGSSPSTSPPSSGSSSPILSTSTATDHRRPSSTERSRNAEALIRKAMQETQPPRSIRAPSPAHNARDTETTTTRTAPRSASPAKLQETRTSDSEALLLKAIAESQPSRERIRAPSPAPTSSNTDERVEGQLYMSGPLNAQKPRNNSDSEALLLRMSAQDANERLRKSNGSANSLLDRLQSTQTDTTKLDDLESKSTNPFSLSNFTQKKSTNNPPVPTTIKISTPHTMQPPPPSQYHTTTKLSEPKKKKSSAKKPPLSPRRNDSDEDFSQLDQFEKEMRGNH